MPVIDIIILGLAVNVFLFILFSLFMTVHVTADIMKDPRQMMELNKLERVIKNHKQELMHAEFNEKYKNLLIFMMPFSLLVKYPHEIYCISKAGGFYEYTKKETERLKEKRHKSHKRYKGNKSETK